MKPRQRGFVVSAVLALLGLLGFGGWYLVADSDWNCAPGSASWALQECASARHARAWATEARSRAVSGPEVPDPSPSFRQASESPLMPRGWCGVLQLPADALRESECLRRWERLNAL